MWSFWNSSDCYAFRASAGLAPALDPNQKEWHGETSKLRWEQYWNHLHPAPNDVRDVKLANVGFGFSSKKMEPQKWSIFVGNGKIMRKIGARIIWKKMVSQIGAHNFHLTDPIKSSSKTPISFWNLASSFSRKSLSSSSALSFACKQLVQ